MLFNVSQDNDYMSLFNNFPIASGNYNKGFAEIKSLAE